jgi:hypothetical protein
VAGWPTQQRAPGSSGACKEEGAERGRQGWLRGRAPASVPPVCILLRACGMLALSRFPHFSLAPPCPHPHTTTHTHTPTPPIPSPHPCRLTRELAGDPLLARLMRAQNERLHEVAAQGLDHPLFQ